MTTDDPKPLSPDLLALLGAEKGAVFAPSDAKVRVLARLGGLTGPVGPGGGTSGGGGEQGTRPRAAARAPSPPSLTTALAFVLGVGVGGVAVHWGTATPAEPPHVVHVDRREEQAVPSAAWHTVATSAPPSPTVSAGPESAPTPGPRERSIAEALTASAAATDQLAAERSLLDEARTALARGNGGDALAAVAAHEQRYPSGALAEEREAMAIQALLLVKRFDDGRARGGRFHKRFPRSVLMPAVDAALASIP